MEIIKYTDDWKEKWDNFVLSSNNGTIFHLQKFFDYHEPGKFTFDHLIFLEKSEIVAVLPGQIKNGLFESPIGASYGSIVTHDLKFSFAMELISTLLNYGRKNNIKEFMLTPAPIIYEDYPNQNLDFAMLWQGFKYDLHYISSAIKLDKEQDIISRFQATVRRNIRKTLKNDDIRIEINEKYDEFYPILLSNKARHDVKPTHSYEDLIKLKKLLPENLKLFMVYYKDKPIGGSLMFFCNENVALCFYNMLLYEYEHLKPIHRVMYEVVKWSTEHGYRYVDIGVSQDTKAENPMTPSMSLIDFKEKFDAKTVMRNTFDIKI
jgi:Acetyltransferase (GNAT) domain